MAPIDDALEDLKSQEHPNYSYTAKKYGIERTKLSRRHRGIIGSKEEATEEKRLLNKQQQKNLVQYVNTLSERGLPPTNAMVRNFARDICGKQPGHNWVLRFVSNHKHTLKSDYLEGLDSSRRKADSTAQFTYYFERVYNLALSLFPTNLSS
jgi:hypothetical protein